MKYKLDFSSVLHQVRNLKEKFESFERVCGAGLIHDTSEWSIIFTNLEKILKHYTQHPREFSIIDWSKSPSEKWYPNQKEFDEYFSKLFTKAENFLVKNIKY